MFTHRTEAHGVTHGHALTQKDALEGKDGSGHTVGAPLLSLCCLNFVNVFFFFFVAAVPLLQLHDSVTLPL